jgi:ABC-type xylose transport system permease subunit
MNGVDILAMEEVAVIQAFGWTWFWTVTIVIGVTGLIYSICEFLNGYYRWPYIPAMTSLFIFVGLLFGTLAGVTTTKPREYETRYKVLISDEVSMTEFLEKYEIVNTEGKIYTIREK